MLLEASQRLSHELGLLVSLTASSLALEILVTSVVSWMIWYSYNFVIRPILYPHSPKQLPYWIPVLGHTYSFLKDPQTLVDYGRRYFKNTRDPYALVVGGQTLYILTSAHDVQTVYKNSGSTSWAVMLTELFPGFGVNPIIVPLLWEDLPQDVLSQSRSDLSLEKIPKLSWVHSSMDLYRRQLLPGPKLDEINDTLISYIDQSLTMDYLSETMLFEKRKTIERMSLRSMCSEVLVRAVTNTIFGPVIYQIEPELTRHLVDFNQDAWMIVFKYRYTAHSRLAIAREKILTAFETYLQLPTEACQGRSWLMTAMVHEVRALDISDRDRAALLLMTHWAANINPTNLAFWMLSYIYFDPELLQSLKSETAKGFCDGEMNLPYIMQDCPRLDAAFNETMRVVHGSLSARKIVAPIVVGDKVLDAGHTIMIPFRQLHHNDAVFGSDIEEFHAERFLRDPNLLKSPSFRPFGGGTNFCPGRFLAKQEILAFIALTLNRFDAGLSLGFEQKFPELDITTPAIGMNAAKEGQDLLINLRRPQEA